MLNFVGCLFGDVNIDLIVKEGVDLVQAPLNLLNFEQGAHGGTSAGQGQASSISFLLNGSDLGVVDSSGSGSFFLMATGWDPSQNSMLRHQLRFLCQRDCL